MIRFLLITLFLSSSILLYADEGMWSPLLLRQSWYSKMSEQGLQLSPDDIYSEENVSFKDAVVSFGGSCTGVIVSSEGLLLTNHHCGYSYVQQQSDMEHNYIDDGFWAKNRTEELPNPGLSVRILVRMEDVSDIILSGISPDMPENQRKKLVAQNTKQLIEQSTPKGREKTFQCTVRPFYSGNQFFISCYEVFQDVRLVGTPPVSIGKFGGSTDNWTWPRQTGDFAVFRIYADRDNQPAAYSTENVPYKPKKFVAMSIRNAEEDSFSWLMGFPASSSQFMTSYGLDMLINKLYNKRISLTGECLKIWDRYMKDNPEINIQYAAKYAGLSNGWKKMQGTLSGITKSDYIKKLQEDEKRIAEKLSSDKEREQYLKLLSELKENYINALKYETAFDGLRSGLMGIEIFQQAEKLMPALNRKTSEANIEKMLKQQEAFYKDYNAQMDMEVFIALVDLYLRFVPSEFHPDIFSRYRTGNNTDVMSIANDVYSSSILTSYDKFQKAFSDSAVRANILSGDPAFEIIKSVSESYNKNVWPQINEIAERVDSLNREYTQMICNFYTDSDRKLYPDANQTMRISYGKKEAYRDDKALFPVYTYFDEVIEKAKSGLPEYQIPERLLKLHSTKDYGPYAHNGLLPVCFITSAHTTNGNSGSPVFNSRGELTGLNFDRNSEGTMSDIIYDSSTCRNIAVDVRYILFIIDRYADAKNILSELLVIN